MIFYLFYSGYMGYSENLARASDEFVVVCGYLSRLLQ
jgi:hypothetical protein